MANTTTPAVRITQSIVTAPDSSFAKFLIMFSILVLQIISFDVLVATPPTRVWMAALLGVVSFDILPEIFEVVHEHNMNPSGAMIALVVGFLRGNGAGLQ